MVWYNKSKVTVKRRHENAAKRPKIKEVAKWNF